MRFLKLPQTFSCQTSSFLAGTVKLCKKVDRCLQFFEIKVPDQLLRRYAVDLLVGTDAFVIIEEPFEFRLAMRRGVEIGLLGLITPKM